MRLTILLGTAGATTPRADALQAAVAGRRSRSDTTSATWPFRRTVAPSDKPEALVIPALHDAFPAGQMGGTRLVLTQSTYQLQRCLDWLDANPESIVVGDLTTAPPGVQRDASTRRGPWSRLHVVEVAAESPTAGAVARDLHDAFTQPDPEIRYDACRRAVRAATGDAAPALALASACMETGRIDEAEEVLRHAGASAPDWEAVHFEQGKLWLRRDDTARAADAFAEAARLMPTFAAAHANLGAALGELERPEDALTALERAAHLDPFGHVIRNNVGASLRDLGRLAEAEAAFQRVVELSPSFVFGHYNLGHVLFLQGRFGEARAAYEAGLALDPARTPQQRSRLALSLAATGDREAAVAHARAALDDVADDRRGDLLDEMEEVLKALTALHRERRPAVHAVEQVVRGYRPALPRS
jgi:Flp pilus assembly protein TadD